MNGSLRLRKPDAHEVQHTTALGTGGIRIVILSVSIRIGPPPQTDRDRSAATSLPPKLLRHESGEAFEELNWYK